MRKLGVEHHQAVAAFGKAVRVDGVGPPQAVQREAAHRGVAAGKKPLAGRKIIDGLRDRLPVRIDRHDCPGKTGGQSQPGAKHGHRPTAARQPAVRKSLKKRLEETHFRTDAARGQLAVEADQPACAGLDRIVARVANERAGERGQPHLRKQPIDQRLLRRGNADVEDAGPIDGVAPAQREVPPDAPRQRDVGASAVEREARPPGLLDAAGERAVGRRAENSALAVGEPGEILVEPVRPF